MSVFWVFVTICASGVAGGIGGALASDEVITRKLDDDGNRIDKDGKLVFVFDDWAALKMLVLGVLAALVVPLFLVLAAPGQQENIMKQLMTPTCPAVFDTVTALPDVLEEMVKDKKALETQLPELEKITTKFQSAVKRWEAARGKCVASSVWWNNLLVLVGFCIVLAFVAQRFLGTVADKLLKEAKQEAEDAKRMANKARADSRQALDAAKKLGPDQQLDEPASTVLKAFANATKATTTADELVKLTKLKVNEVSDALEDLSGGGLVVQDEQTKSWRLRGWGMTRIRTEAGLGDLDKRILQSLNDAGDDRPTAKALSKVLKASEAETNKALRRIERLGLATESTSIRGGWRIRSWGKSLLNEDAD